MLNLNIYINADDITDTLLFYSLFSPQSFAYPAIIGLEPASSQLAMAFDTD